MGVLRTFYSTNVREDRDDPTRHTPVRWYQAPAGAFLFPGRHRFFPIELLTNLGADNSIGEITGEPRSYYKGNPPFASTGHRFCGGQDLFFSGARNSDFGSHSPAWPALRSCCLPPVVPCFPNAVAIPNQILPVSRSSGLPVPNAIETTPTSDFWITPYYGPVGHTGQLIFRCFVAGMNLSWFPLSGPPVAFETLSFSNHPLQYRAISLGVVANEPAGQIYTFQGV